MIDLLAASEAPVPEAIFCLDQVCVKQGTNCWELLFSTRCDMVLLSEVLPSPENVTPDIGPSFTIPKRLKDKGISADDMAELAGITQYNDLFDAALPLPDWYNEYLDLYKTQ